MNILLVSSFLPYPLFSGGHVRLFNIIKELSKNNSITLVCEKRDYQTDSDVQELEQFCKKVIVFPRKKQWSLSTILQTGFSMQSFLVTGHTNSTMKKEITKLLSKNSFDLIHVETFYVGLNIGPTTIPIVLIEHNIEYLVYQRFCDHAPFLLRPFLALDIQKLKRTENAFWKKATKLVAVSPDEKDIMNRKDVVVVPNGVDLQKFEMRNSKFEIEVEKTVLFIGDFKWVQNRDSLQFILTEILPLLKNKVKIKLWVVGKNIPDYLKNLCPDKNIIFDEQAPDDTEEIYKRADILLAPIRIGGGTSFKILEAMASGVPVVTSSLGIEGIDVRNGKEFIRAENVSDYVQAVQRLCMDSALYAQIALSARKVIEEKYDWKKIVKVLEGVYASAIA